MLFISKKNQNQKHKKPFLVFQQAKKKKISKIKNEIKYSNQISNIIVMKTWRHFSSSSAFFFAYIALLRNNNNNKKHHCYSRFLKIAKLKK